MRTDAKRIAKAFGGVLAELRRAVGLTQEELGHEAGLERTYISLLERGQRHPSLRVLIALCGPLGIAASEAMRIFEDGLRRPTQR